MPKKSKSINVPPVPQAPKKTPTPKKASKPFTSARSKKDPMAAFFNIAQNPKLFPMFPTGASGRAKRSRIEVEDEYIADIAGSTSFATTPYAVNPGQSGTFPWLSKEALLFEKYKILRLEFYYRPQVSAFATNGQTGKVMLSFDFDASDAPPASKQQVEDTHPHSDGMPYEEVLLTIDPKDCSLQDSYFVRPGGLPGSSDIKTYDAGILAVSTIGCNSSANIGELRVRYAIALHDPVLENVVSAPTNYHVSNFQSTSGETAGVTGAFKTLLLASTITNGVGATNTSGVITLPVGNYVISGSVNTYNNGEEMSVAEMNFLINGSTSPVSSWQCTQTTCYNLSNSATIFVTSTGSTTVALSVLSVYSANATTNFGNLVIQAI